MDLGLKNKVVIITGGSSGLGYETAVKFAGEGASVALTFNSRQDKASDTAGLISDKYSVKAEAYFCDISSADSVETFFKKVLSAFGRVDILVNNAAYWPKSYVKDMELADWKKCLDVNLTGHFLFSRIFVRYLLDNNRKGKIINIVSFAGFIGSTTGHAHYAASKAGLVAFTKSLARELGSSGINVNAVSPGMMYTPMTEHILKDKESDYIKRIPLGRIADPSEVASSVVFLSSDKADYITGATLDVSGGLLMH